MAESKEMIRNKKITLEVWFLKISSSRDLSATLPSDLNSRDFSRRFPRFESQQHFVVERKGGTRNIGTKVIARR